MCGARLGIQNLGFGGVLWFLSFAEERKEPAGGTKRIPPHKPHPRRTKRPAGVFFPSEIAVPVVRPAAQVVADVRHAQKRHHQKHARNHDDPPRVCQQRLLREREHAAPRDHLERQADAHKAQRRLGNHRAAHVHDDHKHDRREKIRRQVAAENVEKAPAHALRCENILAAAQLAHLRAHDLGDARPARQADDERDAPDRGLAQNRLNQHHEQQVRYAQQNLRQAHQQVIEPHRRAAAQRAEHDGDHRGDGRREHADRE